MTKRLPMVAGTATLSLIGLAALAWQASRQAEHGLARRTADRLMPRRPPQPAG